MTTNPLHHLNTVPVREMAALSSTRGPADVLKDFAPGTGSESDEHRLRRASFYADLPDRMQIGITLIGPPVDPRQRSKVLAAALLLIFILVGVHRVMNGPAHYRHVDTCKAVAR